MQNNEYLNDQQPNQNEQPVQEPALEPDAVEQPVEETEASAAPDQETVPPDDPQPTPAKPAKKNAFMIVGVVLLSVALLSALVFGAAALIRAQNPLNLVSDAFGNTMEELLETPESNLNGGSVEVSVDLATFMKSFVGYAAVSGDASMKIYADDTPASAVVAAVNVGGIDVFDLTAVFDEERMAVASDVLFGDDAYGFAFDSFADKFDNSAFGMDGEFSIGLEAQDIIEMFGGLPVSEDFSKDAALLFADFLIELKKSADEHFTVESSNETLVFAGKDCKTTAVTVSIDSLGLFNILYDMAEYVNESPKVRAFLEENAEAIADFLAEMYYDELDSDEIVDEFYLQLAEFLTDMETAKESGTVEETEIDISLTFYVSKSGKYLVGAVLDGEIDGESMKIEVYAGPKPSEMTEIFLCVDDGYTVIEAAFEVEENTKDAYEAAFEILADNESLVDCDYRWDKNDGDFALTLDFYGEVAELDGNYLSDKEGAVLMLDTFAVEDEAYDLGITVTTTYTDKMPEITEYTDLFNMDADEVKEILYEILEDLDMLLG
ncbi:MAG: hypothetical protein IJZ08_00745 [Clostridia bacterium]|nr:hypothetical protein [Clostridia bacterium]